jgi:dihydrofolate reductase/thymidylate synthase
MSKVKFNAILAVSKDLGIGNLGKLPWHIPGELKYFSNTTRTYLKQETPNIVIMGRKTFESLPAS